MRKIPVYCGVVIASLAVVLVFVTATTYIQLAIAIILYPLFFYFAFKIFPPKVLLVATTQPAGVELSQKEDVGIADIDRREFLKVIGIAGIGLVLYSIFVKRDGVSSLFGSSLDSGTTSLQDKAGDTIDPVEKQPTDGYKLTELDDSIIAYFGFTHKDGSWYIMTEDTETGSFRYVRGDSDFTTAWANREHSKYDYYANIF